jgi:hypothetical protein
MSRKWIDALFLRFSSIWPKDWADKCALGTLEAIANEWSLGLAGMSGAQMARAVDHCRVTMTWSPSIAEFRQAAKQGWSDEQRAMQRRLSEEQPALPARPWAEIKAAGAAQARTAKRIAAAGVTRSLANVASGAWTALHEASYARDCERLGIVCPAPDWPRGAGATEEPAACSPAGDFF